MTFNLTHPVSLITTVLLCGCAVDQRVTRPQSTLENAPGLKQEIADWLGGDQLVDMTLPDVAADQVKSTARKAPQLSAAVATSATSPDHGARTSTHSTEPRISDPDQRAPATQEAPRSLSVDVVNVPLHSVLFALARDADVELTLHGEFNSPVTLRADSLTPQDVLERLSRQTPFFWQLREGQLQVRPAHPFTESYAVDYLNLDRTTRSSVGLATRVGTINAREEGQDGVANSSLTRIENVAEHQFWGSLASDLTALFESAGDDERYTLNRDAGLVTVHGSQDTHRRVRAYLESWHDNAQRQVLIEATVLEVALSDSFETGIDWQVLANGISGVSAAQVLTGAPLLSDATVGRLPAPAGLVSLVHKREDLDVAATLSLLEKFGDVRILSRPRIIALNNQSSVLKVVDNRVYFTVNVERRSHDDEDEVITATDIHTVPVGLVMNVTPFISDSGVVMLNVRPSLSRILGFVNDPNPELAAASVRNGVPEIQVREMESMLRVKSGDLAIIGGLMQETLSDDNARLPGLGAIPLLGRLFSQRKRARKQTELVIVLRPTVMAGVTSGVGQLGASGLPDPLVRLQATKPDSNSVNSQLSGSQR